MHEGHGFLWLTQLPGLHHAPVHVITTVFLSLVIMACTWLASRQLATVRQSEGGGLVPDSKLSFRNFFEIAAERLYMLVETVMGKHDAPVYFPLIGTLFVFIFTSNIIGLIPGFLPPTEDLNTTLALGTFVFFYYNFRGIKEHGFGYIKQFLGPVWWLAWFIILIEIISHVVRPLSLALRLRGNMKGDHMVLTTFLELSPYVVPVIFYGLGTFVCFIQAFVFCLLTMVYISLATSHDH